MFLKEVQQLKDQALALQRRESWVKKNWGTFGFCHHLSPFAGHCLHYIYTSPPLGVYLFSLTPFCKKACLKSCYCMFTSTQHSGLSDFDLLTKFLACFWSQVKSVRIQSKILKRANIWIRNQLITLFQRMSKIYKRKYTT